MSCSVGEAVVVVLRSGKSYRAISEQLGEFCSQEEYSQAKKHSRRLSNFQQMLILEEQHLRLLKPPLGI